MALFWFSDNCIYTVNGAPARSPFETDRDFALVAWKDGCLPVCRIISATAPRGDCNTSITDFSCGRYLLKCDPTPLPPSPSLPLCQCECACGRQRHLITAYGSCPCRIAIETDGEYFGIDCPVFPDDMSAACTPLNRGTLIRISCGGAKKFLCILLYDGDYRLLLKLCADRLTLSDDGVCAEDDVGGMLGCTVCRTLAFRDGAFAEVRRTCRYAYDHVYPDELIGELFVYKHFYGDSDGCAALLSRDCPAHRIEGLLGGYSRIFDAAPAECAPCVVCVADSPSPYCRVRKIRFSVSGGLITGARLI